MKKRGLTLGKFAPFHKGHEYLIETALEEVIGKTKELDMDQVRKEVAEQQAQAQQQ